MLGLSVMASDKQSSLNGERRVVNFRRNSAGTRPPAVGPVPVEDIVKYKAAESPNDYRHRMIVNVAAFAFVIALIGVGYWLADTMALMRKNQDCVLSGRRGCTPVEVPVRDRF